MILEKSKFYIQKNKKLNFSTFKYQIKTDSSFKNSTIISTSMASENFRLYAWKVTMSV